jgi:hypothetical protein
VPIETQLVFPVQSLLHYFEVHEAQGFQRVARVYRQIEEFLEDLSFAEPTSLDTALGDSFLGDGHGAFCKFEIGGKTMENSVKTAMACSGCENTALKNSSLVWAAGVRSGSSTARRGDQTSL